MYGVWRVWGRMDICICMAESLCCLTEIITTLLISYATAAAKLLQSCPTLWDRMNYSSPGSSVHGILQARILEWLLCPPPGDLPNPGIKPTSLIIPALAGGFFTTKATWEATEQFRKKIMMYVSIKRRVWYNYTFIYRPPCQGDIS